MRKNARKTALLTAAVFACFARQPACAQEPEAYQLDTVVVTATRSERAPLDTPANYMNHASLNSIPVDQIAKIEIVKGANSVLYGPLEKLRTHAEPVDPVPQHL
ncbi:MAG: TonB-dependent receptor plug domain-containing protein [Succiniclasticum sp.]|nr:TonB-dependent receptor plug domain-containing protein [Succiniclasticum sp.]MDY6346472.1 TonB-dependent receptor plug domain-containing protein [Succiniclasticum sp.]